jgi:hypothetical protein
VPWKECNQMDERLKFIARLLDGEKMAVLCRQFGISRKTGYKILTLYNVIGADGRHGAHEDRRSRCPYGPIPYAPCPPASAPFNKAGLRAHDLAKNLPRRITRRTMDHSAGGFCRPARRGDHFRRHHTAGRYFLVQRGSAS